MSTLSGRHSDKPVAAPVAPRRTAFRRVVACVDKSALARKVIPHAVAIARAMGAALTLMRVIEARPAGETPPDPVEWDIRRREARDQVEQLGRDWRDEAARIEVEVAEGQPAEQICLWARDHRVDLTVLCSHGEGGVSEWDLGTTARKVIDRAPGSVLLIPASVADTSAVCYRRLLVALDGSSRAESVIPLVTRLAKAQGAEIVLAHVVPVPELTETGPLSAEDLELREQLLRRNERIAHEYLDRLRAQVVESGISARSLVLRNGDVRGRLASAIAKEAADLVVLSSQGRSGRSDAPLGSVAAHLTSHAATPVLIVRWPLARRAQRVRAVRDAGIRLPDQATQ